MAVFAAALEAVADRKLVETSTVELLVTPSDKGVEAWKDLPIKEVPRSRQRGLKNLVVAFEHTGPIDLNIAQERFMAKDYASLPAPLGTLGDTSACKFKMQLLVFQLPETPGGEDRCFILKHYIYY